MLQSQREGMARLLRRRSRNGQSIILIAFAFIALIAFVGIATDVALLFVRYSALRRAVDAAAIAAAGQVRENATFLTLHAVAEQYMQMHGIQASSVKIETCETEIYDWLQIPANVGKTNADAMTALIAGNSELCKTSPEKLVRVTGQIDSPTVFLSILGWHTVTLQTSSISQTAVLDVAIVLDTSLSEAYDTYLAQSHQTGGVLDYPKGPNGYATDPSVYDNSVSLRNFKPFTDPIASGGLGLGAYNPSSSALGNIRRECWYTPSDNYDSWANYAWGACCNDPTIQSDAPGDAHTFYIDGAGVGHDFNTDPNWYVYQDPNSADSQIMLTGTSPSSQPAAHLLAGGSSAAGTAGPLPANSNGNDAKGDGNYSDLVCQPFKQVRDAARRFIQRLDFVRGDRVVLVKFDSQAKAITPYGSGVEIIDNKATAIRALNMQIGVEVNPNYRQTSCQSRGAPNNFNYLQNSPWNQPPMDAKYGSNVNPNDTADYWSVAQCPDTNMGGGIEAANAALVDPRWIRREAVWVMVILSDGYPNRTPALPASGASSVGAVDRSWLTTDLTAKPSDAPTLAKYCDYSVGDPLFGTKPEYCTGWGLPGPSFGFCPNWTYNPTGANPAPAWNTSQTEPAVPYCLDNDPDSRHFCMDAAGKINPTISAGDPYYCDTHYDADDFAKDRADFAGLIDYTDTTKGNFIAMYSIFFSHQSSAAGSSNIGVNILGVKTLRYIADAGDDGIIENHLQKWYRDVRDGKISGSGGSFTNPPSGRNGTSKGGQPVPPTYDGSNSFFLNAPVSYQAQEDPCAQYDFNEISGATPGSAAYENAAKQSCGQFFFASDQNSINKAFLEIASRLFTRLSR